MWWFKTKKEKLRDKIVKIKMSRMTEQELYLMDIFENVKYVNFENSKIYKKDEEELFIQTSYKRIHIHWSKTTDDLIEKFNLDDDEVEELFKKMIYVKFGISGHSVHY